LSGYRSGWWKNLGTGGPAAPGKVGRDSVEPILPPQAVRAPRASSDFVPRGKMLTAFASLRSKAGSPEFRPTVFPIICGFDVVKV
jgi:hypothetical protein